MQPNNQPQYSIDYLDSIAAKPAQQTMNPLLLWAAIIGGLLALVVLVMMLLSAGGPSSTDKLTYTAARLANLQTIATAAKANVQSTELRTINSTLTLTLTNANRDLGGILTAQNIKLTEKNDKNVAKAAGEMSEVSNALEDARLNAVYNRVYVREMTYYLKQLRSEITELSTSSDDAALKKVLATTDANLKPIVQDFSTYKAD